jgi:probable phosphoglycerate mutase
VEVNRRVPGRAYQAVRDPKRLLIEKRAEALSVAGYPLLDDDSAMYAEQRLQAAREAAGSSEGGSAEENTSSQGER